MPPQAQALAEHPPFMTEDKTSHDIAGSHSKVKCVLVGDGAIGKTSLVVSYTTNGYPTEYVPTAFDNYSVVVTIDENPVRLQLCDTAGQDDFDSLRPLCYPQTDVFLLCFSVVSPTSFHNILDKWLPEIRKHSPHTPIILVGTQSDLRSDVKVMIELARYNERPVTELEAKQRAEDMGALCYIECSALTQKNMKDVFDSALLAALDVNGNVKRRKSGSKRWKKGSKKSNSEEEMRSSKKSKHSDSRSPHTLSATSDVLKKTGWKRFCCML